MQVKFCRKDKGRSLLHTTAFPNVVESFSTLAPIANHNERIHHVILFHGVIKQWLRLKHPFLFASLT